MSGHGLDRELLLAALAHNAVVRGGESEERRRGTRGWRGSMEAAGRRESARSAGCRARTISMVSGPRSD